MRQPHLRRISGSRTQPAARDYLQALCRGDSDAADRIAEQILQAHALRRSRIHVVTDMAVDSIDADEDVSRSDADHRGSCRT